MADPKADEKKLEKLRDAWQSAIEREKPAEAAKALKELGDLEPKEPRWPHRHGEMLAKLGRKEEAERALAHASQLSDGLYLAMSGALESDGAKVASEAVLLRLPATKFGTFIAEFPPALAHLSELADEPMAL